MPNERVPGVKDVFMEGIFDDHCHEECGVYGIFGHERAAQQVYLGLYALQHRGQESAGIASEDTCEIHLHSRS